MQKERKVSLKGASGGYPKGGEVSYLGSLNQPRGCFIGGGWLPPNVDRNVCFMCVHVITYEMHKRACLPILSVDNLFSSLGVKGKGGFETSSRPGPHLP